MDFSQFISQLANNPISLFVAKLLQFVWTIYYNTTFYWGGTIWALSLAAIFVIAAIGIVIVWIFVYRKLDFSSVFFVCIVVSFGILALIFVIQVGAPMQQYYYSMQEAGLLDLFPH